ncbi:MAG: hypothetical protein ACTHOU_14885 [Aureliella sp.]
MGNSPFASLRLYRNPFGELTRAERAELAQIDLGDCLSRLTHERSVLQIIGPCGHGKTTHLLAIERALPQSAYVYFPEDGFQPPLPKTRPLLVDEAQRLGWRRRRELLAGPGPLVISTHVDLERKLRRAGFEVWTLDLARPKSPSQILKILNARIAASGVQTETGKAAPPESLFLKIEQVVALQQRFGSNIRLIEHHLYEAFQRTAGKGEPWLPAS